MGLRSEEKEVCPWQCHHGQQEQVSSLSIPSYRVGIAELYVLLRDAPHYCLKISVPKVLRGGTQKSNTSPVTTLPLQTS